MFTLLVINGGCNICCEISAELAANDGDFSGKAVLICLTGAVMESMIHKRNIPEQFSKGKFETIKPSFT